MKRTNATNYLKEAALVTGYDSMVESPTLSAMSYRHHAVIPADFQRTAASGSVSFQTRFSLKENEKPCVETNVEKTPTYSRSMTAAGILFLTAGLAAFLATPNNPPVSQAAAETIKQWSLDSYSMVGAILSAAGVCLLHNTQEGKRIIAGRVIFTLLAGFIGPWLVEILPFTWKLTHPKAQVLIGSIFGLIGYVFSRYFVEIIFKRAFGISQKVVDYGEKKLDEKLK